MIKAVIFDFFGVLVTEGFRRFCNKYFPFDKTKRRKALGLVTAHDWGNISQKEYMSGLAELAGVDEKVVAEHMEDNQPNDALLDYIRNELKPGYKIGVLSNSGDDYLSQILDPEDTELFDDIVLSFRYRMVKPQLEIFEFAAERLGVKTDECIFIDDSQSHCAGAAKAGMQTILYQDFPDFKKKIEKILAAGTDN
jgi:putative hydrolase of the HAD superfamily